MEIKRQKNLLILTVEGDFDLSLCPEIKEGVTKEIENNGVNRIIFDMAGVTFIDSSGLGLILTCYKKTAPSGGGVGLKNLPPHLLQFFEMAGLDRIINISLLKEVHHA